ncbi:hypothetical protein Lesp02_45900 [Lentzea sp. NBRC 105346]|nr:hypothetical protein Lesp02_45900 [Lentzea sp. NBRC 105346]
MHNAPPPVDWTGTSNLPARNPRFTGRVDLLAELDRLDGPVVLRGLGGVGKSQLALEHAHGGEFTVRWWVRAANESTLTADLVALADALGFDITHERVVARLLVELGKRDDWLLVLDNAEDPELLTRFPSTGRVVITTRNRGISGVTVDVPEMTHGEAVAFLDEAPDAAELAEVLGHLPLALAQARAYVDVHGCSIRRYLDLYAEASAELLKIGPKPVGYPHTVATTWLLHFRALSKAAVGVLELTAFLAPDSIPLGLLLHVLPKEEVARESVIGELVATSLLARADDHHVRVHRLVQEVTRSRLTAKERAKRLSHTVRFLGGLLPDAPAMPENWPLMAAIGPHAQAAALHVKTTSRDAKLAGLLLSGVGMHLRSRGEPAAAVELFERAMSLHDGRSRTERLARAGTWMEIGAAQAALRDPPAMVKALNQAMTLLDRTLGPAHPLLVEPLTQMSMMLIVHDQHELAMPRLRSALMIKLAQRGEQDVELAMIMHNLAMCAGRAKQHSESLTFHHMAIGIIEKLLGPEHSQLVSLLPNYAADAIDAGQPELARSLLLRALPVLREKLGPEHEHTRRAERLLAELGQT